MEWQAIWQVITSLYPVVVIFIVIFYLFVGGTYGLRQISKDKERYGYRYVGRVKFISCCQAFFIIITWLPAESMNHFLCGLSGGESPFFGIDL
ncbi:MAG: hypothetical protein HQ537_01960 [Parcubacteria group bacterium]|nr:hypothetical protein [Parcubacteria group bacterium]